MAGSPVGRLRRWRILTGFASPADGKAVGWPRSGRSLSPLAISMTPPTCHFKELLIFAAQGRDIQGSRSADYQRRGFGQASRHYHH